MDSFSNINPKINVKIHIILNIKMDIVLILNVKINIILKNKSLSIYSFTVQNFITVFEIPVPKQTS